MSPMDEMILRHAVKNLEFERDTALKRAEAAEAEVARLRDDLALARAVADKEKQRGDTMARRWQSLAESAKPYTPRVGDVVGFGGDCRDDGDSRVVMAVDGDHAWVKYSKRGERAQLKTSLMTFMRRATAEERAAAGLPAEAPAKPEVLPEHLAWIEASAKLARFEFATKVDPDEKKECVAEALLAAHTLRAAVARRDGGAK